MKTRSIMKNKIALLIIGILSFIGVTGCSDFLSTNPSDSVPNEEISKSVTNLEMVMQNAYKELITSGSGFAYAGLLGFQSYLDLRGQDVVSYNIGSGWDYQYIYEYNATVTEASGSTSAFWDYFYGIIRQANTVIKFIDSAPGDDALRADVKGQALALRAYCYFYMAQLYQQTYYGNENLKNVILRTVPVDPADVSMGRASTKEVYDQVRADLNAAIDLLPESDGSVSYEINKNIAEAILAKVSLVTHEWSTAESMAHAAKAPFALMEPIDYLKGFTLNPYVSDDSNPEWMWYLPQTLKTSIGDATPAAAWGNRNHQGIKWETDYLFASEDLLALYETSDVRFAQFWQRNESNRVSSATGQGYWASNKFSEFYKGDFANASSASPDNKKINPNYTGTNPSADDIYSTFSNVDIPSNYIGQLNLIRAADMWLVEAEAMAREGGKDASALSLLNELRAKRNASQLTGLTGTNLIDEILKERRRELYGEGTDLFDMLRTNSGLARSASHTSNITIPAGDYRFLNQIPSAEFTYNKDLDIIADQNPFDGTTIPSNMTVSK
jgi:starch-binding outer membrane protein, SusD/RagB family